MSAVAQFGGRVNKDLNESYYAVSCTIVKNCETHTEKKACAKWMMNLILFNSF